MGLINKVFPAQSFREKAEEFITKLTSLSGPVLRLTKRAVDKALYARVTEGIAEVEKLYLNELMQTEDAHEGLHAFLEKRKPTWKNK
jgi:enoyl-CoA hydratase/carnithine racemase